VGRWTCVSLLVADIPFVAEELWSFNLHPKTGRILEVMEETERRERLKTLSSAE
jgi:hypothetical protein